MFVMRLPMSANEIYLASLLQVTRHHISSRCFIGSVKSLDFCAKNQAKLAALVLLLSVFVCVWRQLHRLHIHSPPVALFTWPVNIILWTILDHSGLSVNFFHWFRKSVALVLTFVVELNYHKIPIKEVKQHTEVEETTKEEEQPPPLWFE